jgi:hypothetical protein
MTREELEKAIHFRTIDAPCCGNCKWFKREWEDTECKHPQNFWTYPDHPEFTNRLAAMDEHNVCDRFERREA